MRASAAAAADLADLVASKGVVSGAAARERTQPVLAAFDGLLPQGIQRGSVVECAGTAAVSLALGLAAGPCQHGAWVAVAGLPTLGLAAATELGIALERLVLVAEPAVAAGSAGERWNDGQWGDVLAAMVDGFDVLVLGPGTRAVRSPTARRVVARLQARGSIALTVDTPVFAADLRVVAGDVSWLGLGEGHGVAQGRKVTVALDGRRVPRPRRARLWLPAHGGQVLVADDPQVVPLRRTG